MLHFQAHEDIKDLPLLVRDLVAAPFYSLRTLDFLTPILRDYHFDEKKFTQQVTKTAYTRLHVKVERTAPTPLLLRDETISYKTVISLNFLSFAGSNTNAKVDPPPTKPSTTGLLPAELAQVNTWLQSEKFAGDDAAVTLPAAQAKRDAFKAYYLIAFDDGDARAQIVSAIRYHDLGFSLPLFEDGLSVYGAAVLTPARKDWRLPVAGGNPCGLAVDPQYAPFDPIVYLGGTLGVQTRSIITGGIGSVIKVTLTQVP